jgi:cellulose synthase/poly-beta-1,6-N-acetylglucosamine synthase-like glycosyltransferase
MKVIPIIYLAYMFIALYMFFFLLYLYLRNKNHLFDYPRPIKNYSISVITPAYNEEDSIEGTILSVLGSNYPIREMIVINDNSSDRTKEIVEKLMGKYKNLKLINNNGNLGKAGSLNKGLKITKGEIVAIIDSDSFPQKDAIRKCLGFFNDKEVAAVTCSVLVKDKNTFMRKLQAFEYSIIAWTRKLLGYIGGIWAMPGPLAMYRTEIIRKIGGFDTNNLTEDIEITWRIVKEGYKIKMCLASRVYSIAPDKFSIWFKQRVRWNTGGLQCINKYKSLFFRKGMLGFFILPFFTLSLILGLVGLSVFSYITTTNLYRTFFYTQYSFAAGTSLLSAQNLYVSPSVLNFFGIVLFLLGLFFTLAGLGVMGEKKGGIRNVFNLLFYTIVYLTAYPFIMLYAIIKTAAYKIQGKRLGWGTK